MPINPLGRSYGTTYGTGRSQSVPAAPGQQAVERRHGERRREILPVADERRQRARRRGDSLARDAQTARVLLDLRV